MLLLLLLWIIKNDQSINGKHDKTFEIYSDIKIYFNSPDGNLIFPYKFYIREFRHSLLAFPGQLPNPFSLGVAPRRVS